MEITVREAKKAIEFNLDHNIKRSILLLGPPGIGKSDIVKEICMERGIGFIDLRLLLYTETDLKGVPVPDRETHTTLWYSNVILPHFHKDLPRGILLIDELTSAPKRVQAAAYQLIQDRKLGEYILPDGWFIVSAGNREEDDGVFVQIPSPLADRFEILTVIPDLDIWKADFAYKNNIHPDVIGYLNFKPQALHTQVPGESSLEFATPRSWASVSEILSNSDFNDTICQIKIAGNIGDLEFSGFREFMKYKETLISADSIINGSIKAIPKERSLQCHLISAITTKLLYLRDSTSLDEDAITALTNVCEFYLGMKAEMLLLGVKDLLSINKKLITQFLKIEFDSSKMFDFIAEHRFLFE